MHNLASFLHGLRARTSGRDMRKADLQLVHRILETRGGFGHREHLELAWNCLRIYPIDEAGEVMTAAIRHVARLHDAEGKYHETMTRASLHLVAVHMQRWGADSFESFLECNPDLLDSKLIGHFYSPETILGEPARTAWAPPDRHALPSLA